MRSLRVLRMENILRRNLNMALENLVTGSGVIYTFNTFHTRTSTSGSELNCYDETFSPAYGVYHQLVSSSGASSAYTTFQALFASPQDITQLYMGCDANMAVFRDGDTFSLNCSIDFLSSGSWYTLASTNYTSVGQNFDQYLPRLTSAGEWVAVEGVRIIMTASASGYAPLVGLKIADASVFGGFVEVGGTYEPGGSRMRVRQNKSGRFLSQQ
jgi:hypothetical protein